MSWVHDDDDDDNLNAEESVVTDRTKRIMISKLNRFKEKGTQYHATDAKREC